MKLASSICGPGDEIRWDPAVTSEVGWEAELGVVIGRPARNIRAEDADEMIFGYTGINDVTARDVQRREQQWVRAKSLDTFGPIGPVIVTRDELDPRAGISIQCRVNGTLMQNSSTAELIFGVHELVAYLSTSFTLQPGDVIATGTPLGVGGFRTPPISTFTMAMSWTSSWEESGCCATRAALPARSVQGSSRPEPAGQLQSAATKGHQVLVITTGLRW